MQERWPCACGGAVMSGRIAMADASYAFCMFGVNGGTVHIGGHVVRPVSAARSEGNGRPIPVPFFGNVNEVWSRTATGVGFSSATIVVKIIKPCTLGIPERVHYDKTAYIHESSIMSFARRWGEVITPHNNPTAIVEKDETFSKARLSVNRQDSTQAFQKKRRYLRNFMNIWH